MPPLGRQQKCLWQGVLKAGQEAVASVGKNASIVADADRSRATQPGRPLLPRTADEHCRKLT